MNRMSIEHARVIRTWRVELDCTWGKVGELAAFCWGWESYLGGEFCQQAAEMLGEKPGEEPWNGE